MSVAGGRGRVEDHTRVLATSSSYLLLYLTNMCSCMDVLGDVGVCHLCSMIWGYASMMTASSRSSPSFTSTDRPWLASLGTSWGSSRM